LATGIREDTKKQESEKEELANRHPDIPHFSIPTLGESTCIFIVSS